MEEEEEDAEVDVLVPGPPTQILLTVPWGYVPILYTDSPLLRTSSSVSHSFAETTTLLPTGTPATPHFSPPSRQAGLLCSSPLWDSCSAILVGFFQSQAPKVLPIR